MGSEATFGSIEELGSSHNYTNQPETRRNGDLHTNGNGLVEDGDEEIVRARETAYLVMGCVTVRWRSDGEINLEWKGNMLNDGIADAVLALLSSIESSPAAIRRMFIISFIFSTRKSLTK